MISLFLFISVYKNNKFSSIYFFLFLWKLKEDESPTEIGPTVSSMPVKSGKLTSNRDIAAASDAVRLV